MDNEKWKDIEGYEGVYQISNKGRVVSFHKEPKMMKLYKNRNGYLTVLLCKNGKVERFYISRLVAKAFIENPLNKKEVNHKNGDKLNNYDFNLEWNTHQENMSHARITGLFNDIKPVCQVERGTGKIIKNHTSMAHASKATNTHQGDISKCCNGKRHTAGGYKWEFAHKENGYA